jgi:hypothetical protein
METISTTDVAQASGILRSVLDTIDRGEIDAEPWQRDYLQGAADALDTPSAPFLRAA